MSTTAARSVGRAAVAGGGQQDGAAVEREPVRGGGGQPDFGEHPDDGRRRVVRVVTVPQGVPLQAVDDRAEAVVLQQQDAAGREACGALGQRGALVREVHQPEAGVDDDVRGARRVPPRVRPCAPSSGSQVPPCGLGYSATVPRVGQHPVRDQALQGCGPLRGQRRRLEAQRLLRHVVGPDQLREPAPGAQPHPQRQQRVRAPGRPRPGTARWRAARPDRAPASPVVPPQNRQATAASTGASAGRRPAARRSRGTR